MGVWQLLAEGYDMHADALMVTYPLSATSISNNGNMIVVVVVDEHGKFIRADKIEKANHKKGVNTEPISIPVTEESMGRSSGISPHPVFEQYEYLKGTGKKYVAYIENLRRLSESSEQIKPIFKYLDGRTIASDLAEMNLKDKTMIIFEVEAPGTLQAKVWQDEAFFTAWHQHYVTEIRKDKSLAVDYITGVEQVCASYHPKKISNASANSKLISDNDDKNFTYRGKFSKSSEAVSIGYETSQKAHQFLRYLVNDRGYVCGEQVILSFAIQPSEKLVPPPIEDKSIWNTLLEHHVKTETDVQIALRAETGIDYSEALKKSLAGYGQGHALKNHAKTVVIALDAATKGRLSITFYRELGQTEYLERIIDWHDSCKWNHRVWDKMNQRYNFYVGAPSVDRIVEAIHGRPRGRNDEAYTRIKKAARERLVRCIFDGAALPFDYVTSAIRRASNPLGIVRDGKFDRNSFEQIVSTACALIRHHYQHLQKEEYSVSIQLERTDRDYLFGRLLGAADKLEEYALYKKGSDRAVTAAIRHMQAFAQRPFRTWQTIHSCLNPYMHIVKGGFAFNEIQAINQLFCPGDYEIDLPLNGSFLIGYYHERAYIDHLVETTKNEPLPSNHNQKEDSHDK